MAKELKIKVHVSVMKYILSDSGPFEPIRGTEERRS